MLTTSGSFARPEDVPPGIDPTQPAHAVEVRPLQAPAPPPVRTLDDLASLSSAQLEGLYRQSGPGPVPGGKVRGLALYPDSRFPRAKARAARVAWQGKVFDPATGTATNRFFGVRMIKGAVYSGQSWLDGGGCADSRLPGDLEDLRQLPRRDSADRAGALPGPDVRPLGQSSRVQDVLRVL